MDEREALSLIGDLLGPAGDDAAVVNGLVISTDMLHEQTDFPAGTTRYTAGWRAVGASLSDIAAMGATPSGAVAVYAAPTFDADEITAFIEGAMAVCERVDTAYVGGDLDHHDEFTVATTAIGQTDNPVLRSGASPGETIYVTGRLGRTAAALKLFDAGSTDRANELFRFAPRVAVGRALGPVATAMMDSSDGLARSLHQLAQASQVGMAIESAPLPIHPTVSDLAENRDDERSLAMYVGEDFELVFTADSEEMAELSPTLPTPVTPIGTVTEAGITLDGDPLPDRGYGHGS